MRKFAALSELHVYQKVIIVFVAMMLPVFLMNLRMNMTGISFMKEGTDNSILSNVNFYSSQLNGQISFVRMQQLQLVNDSDVQKLGFLANEQMDSYDQIQRVARVSESVATIRNSSDYLLNVGVMIESIGKTISTQGRVTQMPNSESELISRYVQEHPGKPLYFHENRLFFIESANNGTIIVYMELSVPHLRETLSRLVGQYEDSGAVLTEGRYGSAIAVNAESPVTDRMQEEDELWEEAADISSHTLKVADAHYRITNAYVSALGMNLFIYMNQNEVAGPLKQLNLWLVLFSVVSVAVIILFSFSVNLMIHKPLKRLIQAFKKVEADNLMPSLRNQRYNEFGYLYRNFDRMVEKLGQSIEENYEQKIALQHSELKQLQSQINPHFLYNSFFNLYMICKSGDADSGAILAQKLGSYYQFITRSGKDEVQLEEEYRHALDYCEIQSIRFSNRIAVEVSDVPVSCAAWEVPRIIIQPLVENAFEHAFSSGARRGNVIMKAVADGNRLSIAVEDDGIGVSDERLTELQEQLDNESRYSEKTGLINVCRRIRLKFGEGSGVTASRSPMGGLKIEIVIEYRD